MPAMMIDPVSLPEQLMYVTTRITSLDAAGKPISVGTGFFFDVRIDETQSLRALVTNKHVIRDAHAVKITVHTKSVADNRPDGKVDVLIPCQSGLWTPAPEEIDLCAVPILPFLPPNAFYRTLDSGIVLSNELLADLDAIEDVFMVGYPSGLWDSVNNYPLVRRGITATHPAVDFEGRPNVVIDLACFPGSSGSPVFIYNPSGHAVKGGPFNIGVTRIIFLGVLFAGPTITSDGEVVIEEAPTGIRGDVKVRSMMNLGYIIKAAEVVSLGAALKARFPPPRAPARAGT